MMPRNAHRSSRILNTSLGSTKPDVTFPAVLGENPPAMNDKLNWGILGTGKIAHRFAQSLPESHTGRLVAVGSRS